MSFRYSDVIFVYDFESLTPNGLLRDFGPHGLHATFPGGANNPTAQLDGSYSFDGGDYLTLTGDAMTRWYQIAPTQGYTAAFVVTLDPSVVGTARCLFEDSNVGAPRYGIAIRWNTGALDFYNNTGAGVQDVVQTLVGNPVNARWAMIATTQATPNAMFNDNRFAANWALGGFGTCVYNPAVVPSIGGNGAVGIPWIGRMYYLLIMRGALHRDDQKVLMEHLIQGRKPFCYRRP